MKKRWISVLLALVMALCVGIPAAGAITEDDMTNAPELALWEETPVTLTTGGGYVYFKILPELTCTYTVYSTGSKDTKGYLYDASGTQIAYNDDINYSNGEVNFSITQELTGGATYYLGTTIYNSGTGSFSVVLEGHDVAEWTTVTEPTCTAPGQQTGTCSLCNNTITREIPPLGHDWGIATSNNNGTHTHTCGRCSVTETEPCSYEEHSEGGFTEHTCTVCGYSYTDEAAGTQSIMLWDFETEPSDWTFVDANEDGYNWGWNDSEAYEGTHTIRSYSYYSGSLSPDNWAISPAFSLVNVTNPTLSLWASGRLGSSWCNEVFAIYAGTTDDPDQMTKISDDITTGNAYANYTADLTDFAGEPTVYIAIRHYNCSNEYWLDVDCVEVIVDVPPCSEHVIVAVPAAEATCTEPGHIAHWACENCGRCFYDAAGTQPALPSDLITSPALGHNWGEWAETTPATCTAGGVETAHCTRCDATKTQPTDPLGHDWGEAVSNNDGTHTYTCNRCHVTHTEDCTFETEAADGVLNSVCTECGYTVRIGDVLAFWDFEYEPYDWWFFDADGDGYNWEWAVGEGWYYHGGEGMIHSASYINNIGVLSPDQFAVSPAFSLADCTDATLLAWARGQDSDYYSEVFAFYAGTSYDPEEWEKVSEDYTATGEYAMYTADLSAFVGEPVVYIAIRHYNCSNEYWLNVDDVSIVGTRVHPCETGNHQLTYVPAKEPTETEDGNIAYYVCENCGLLYLDENGTQPVSALDVILPGGYPVEVDSDIEYGLVYAMVTRAKEGDLVPLTVIPDQGAALEYLAYIDDAGDKTVLHENPKAKGSVPQSIAKEERGKVLDDRTRRNGAVNVTRSETELFENCFDMPASSVTVTAEFGPKYIVTLDPGDAGGDSVLITSLDDDVWGEYYTSAENGQFSPVSIGVDAFNIPDCPFTWNNHTFVSWELVGNSEPAYPGEAYYAGSFTLIAQWATDELADGYYLIGPDWTFEAIDPDELFEVNPGNSDEYMLSTVLSEGDRIKVVHLTGSEIDAWYPEGLDNEYTVDAAHAGNVNIYFQTTYKDDWSAFGGYIWIAVHVHDLTEHEAKNPTCTEAGNSAYWSCEECGSFFSDAEGLTEIDEDSWVIPALGHNPGEPVRENEVPPTYAAEGSYDEVVYCTRCGLELERHTHAIDRLPFEGKVEWNTEDVKFKGTTAYVIANGSAQTPRFTVKNTEDDSVVDPANYDYEYRENTNAGTGYVIVTFKGDYTGTCRGQFKIYLPPTTTTTVANVSNGIKLTWSAVDGADGYVIYRRAWSSTTNGWTDFVRWNNTTSLEWIDTKVYAGTRYQYGIKGYFNRRTDPVSGAQIGGNVGDNYNLGEVGPLKTTVRITTRTLNSVTAGTKQMTVKWAGSSNFTGYQIQYATNAAFTQNAKAIKITNPKTVSTVIKSLTSGKTYYVRVRSYHEFNGMTYFGEWSNVLSCKVK